MRPSPTARATSASGARDGAGRSVIYRRLDSEGQLMADMWGFRQVKGVPDWLYRRYIDRDRKAIDTAVARDAELVRSHFQQRDDSNRTGCK